ncbi:MAG: hypothetical protein JXA09_12240 [Anaerolineae bacterium]|nr:hypothetical protein [Anaerolineae bacterium]
MSKKLVWVALVALLATALMGATALADAEETPLRGLGRVTAVEGMTITVRTLRGVREIHATADTRLRVPGIEDPSIADVEVGDAIAGIVVRDEEGDLVAELIVVLPPRFRGLGRVSAVHGKTITLENRRGTFDVRTDADTRFWVLGVDDPSVKDVAVGDTIAGVVIRDENGDLLARRIVVLPRRLRALGRVTEVQGVTITVENRRGVYEIRTDVHTRYRVPGIEDPTLADIEVGDMVAGVVVRQGNDKLLARLIAVLPPRDRAAP